MNTAATRRGGWDEPVYLLLVVIIQLRMGRLGLLFLWCVSTHTELVPILSSWTATVLTEMTLTTKVTALLLLRVTLGKGACVCTSLWASFLTLEVAQSWCIWGLSWRSLLLENNRWLTGALKSIVIVFNLAEDVMQVVLIEDSRRTWYFAFVL